VNDRSDLDIQADVIAELTWDHRFAPAEVGVEVDQGIVTLRGTISSFAKLRVAGRIAHSVSGVKAVANELEVEPAGDRPRGDGDIARAVRWSLEWDADVPDDRVQCHVRNGFVVLRGTVEHEYQRVAAVEAVSRLLGVRGVQDEISVERRWRPDADVGQDVHRGLAARLPTGDLTVRCRDGVVTLSGRVTDAADRLAAEEVAWQTRGVRHVTDRIAVHGKPRAPA